MSTIVELDELVQNDQNDFIFNNFDLLYQSGNKYLVVKEEGIEYSIPVHFEGVKANLGIWLTEVSQQAITDACKYIFKNYKSVNYIEYKNGLVYPKLSNQCDIKKNNHWKVPFPETEDELRQRLSSKKRYNIKRQKRIASEEIGEYEIFEYNADNVPERIILDYFKFKKITHNIDYNMSADEYLKIYSVSNIYTMMFGDVIGAIVFSCEQGKNVYLENLTYNPEYTKYSLGAILYDDFLTFMIKKKKKNLYLGYGNHQYKKMYGSIEQEIYNVKVYRSSMEYIKNIAYPKIKSNIKISVKSKLRELKIIKN